MKRIEFTTREFPNEIQVRQVEHFSVYTIVDSRPDIVFYYASGETETKWDVIEFKVIDL